MVEALATPGLKLRVSSSGSLFSQRRSVRLGLNLGRGTPLLVRCAAAIIGTAFRAAVAVMFVGGLGCGSNPRRTHEPLSQTRDAGAPERRARDTGARFQEDASIDSGPPERPMPPSAPDLALAGEATCALRAGSVHCWGSNRFGQLSTSGLSVGHRVRRPTPGPVGGLSEPRRLAGGAFHFCALEAAGTIRCWGHNGWGQLGDGTREDRADSVPVAGIDDAVAVGAGEGHSCALRASREVVCWGRNDLGQLGDGSTELRLAPTPVPAASSVIAIALGRAHTCALRSDGEVLCWGENLDGQLGDGTRSEPLGYRPTPAAVHDLVPATAIESGQGHVCARTGGEGVWCWGRNDSMQLGAPRRGRSAATSAATTPVAMEGSSDVVEVAAGSRYTCVRSTAGVVSCVGLDHRGQLGNGSRRLQRRLTPVPELSAVTRIAAGVQHTCAVRADGAVLCWGDDRRDQVGGGRHQMVTTPRVVLPGR